jgi:hypothetical protein
MFRFRDLFSEVRLARADNVTTEEEVEEEEMGRKIKDNADDYEDDEDDYEDNLSQENLRELYIAAVDQAIHKVSVNNIFLTINVRLFLKVRDFMIFSREKH